MSRMRLVFGLAALTGALAACTTVGPDYALPADSRYAQLQAQPLTLDTGDSAALDRGDAAVDLWWKLYDDPVLDGLVRQALDNSVELRVASARLARASAMYQQAAAAGGFDSGAEAGVQRAQVSAESFLQEEKLPVFNLADGGFSASYQTDLFGKLRRATEAAQASAESVMAARDLARISVVAQVVGSYVETCHLNHELHIAAHSIELQQRTHEVAARMHGAGRGTSSAVDRAGAQLATLQAALPPLRARKLAAEYELAALLGRTPDRIPAGVDQCADAPALTRAIPVGDGGALLRRRPDVRRAERELHAATAEVGVATAELYPDITIGASVGAAGLLEDFGKPATQQWSIGPAIHWSIPGDGARARVEVAKAGRQLALAEFDQVVLDALRETQSALSRYVQDLQRVQSLQSALDQAQRAADEDRRLYQAGRRPYLASLDADRTRVSSETALADAQAQVSQDQIHLFLALGGGWQQAASAP
jgi:NodT family efflux transporter outer membrane factor (OMF) lipoprotein